MYAILLSTPESISGATKSTAPAMAKIAFVNSLRFLVQGKFVVCDGPGHVIVDPEDLRPDNSRSSSLFICFPSLRLAKMSHQTQRWPPELFPILATHCNSWVVRKLRLLNKQASRLVTMDALKCAHMLDYLEQYGPEDTMEYIGELGEVLLLKRAMEKGVDIRIGNEIGLVVAAEQGHLNLVNALLAAGADVHGRGTLDHTPGSQKYKEDSAFLWAVEKDHIEVARRLLQAGADIDAYGPLLGRSIGSI